jgi:hypothetical protein
MRASKIALYALTLLLATAFLYKSFFTLVVGPWELNRSLKEGCKIYKHELVTKNLSPKEFESAIGAFTKAAWHDSHYLPVAQAGALVALDAGKTLSDLGQNSYREATALLAGFCLKAI